MSQAAHGVYRCPSCGELAGAEYGDSGTVTCLKCDHVFQRELPQVRKRRSSRQSGVGSGGLVQRNISGKRAPMESQALSQAVLPDSKLAGEQNGEKVVSGDQTHSVSGEGVKAVRRRKRKRRFRIGRMLLVVAWFLSIFAVLTIIKHQKKSFRIKRDSVEVNKVSSVDLALEEQRRIEAVGYVKKSLGECQQAFVGFSSALDAATRAQFVRSGSQMAPQIATHYSQSPPFRSPGALVTSESNLILYKELRAIESIWRSEAGDREVVFIREDGAWKVDWEFFVRHNESPWSLFISEVGAEKGVFRVYLRVKEITSHQDIGKVMSLRFYPPSDEGGPRSRGSSGPVLVPFDSENGRIIKQIMDAREKKPLVGERVFQMRDPEDLHRVRVLLEWREGTDGQRYLHLEQILAGNWLGAGFEENFDVEGVEEVEVAEFSC